MNLDFGFLTWGVLSSFVAKGLIFSIQLTLVAMVGFPGQDNVGSRMAGAIMGIIAFVLAFYLGLGLIALAFYASFFREAVEGLSLTGLDFHFYARTRDWILLFLGDIALVVCTLGIGSIFLQYRHWKFFVTHMGVTGTIYTDELTQSQTKTSRHGEGLLDALDVGAF